MLCGVEKLVRGGNLLRGGHLLRSSIPPEAELGPANPHPGLVEI